MFGLGRCRESVGPSRSTSAASRWQLGARERQTTQGSSRDEDGSRPVHGLGNRLLRGKRRYVRQLGKRFSGCRRRCARIDVARSARENPRPGPPAACTSRDACRHCPGRKDHPRIRRAFPRPRRRCRGAAEPRGAGRRWNRELAEHGEIFGEAREDREGEKRCRSALAELARAWTTRMRRAVGRHAAHVDVNRLVVGGS